MTKHYDKANEKYENISVGIPRAVTADFDMLCIDFDQMST